MLSQAYASDNNSAQISEEETEALTWKAIMKLTGEACFQWKLCKAIYHQENNQQVTAEGTLVSALYTVSNSASKADNNLNKPT